MTFFVVGNRFEFAALQLRNKLIEFTFWIEEKAGVDGQRFEGAVPAASLQSSLGEVKDFEDLVLRQKFLTSGSLQHAPLLPMSNHLCKRNNHFN